MRRREPRPGPQGTWAPSSPHEVAAALGSGGGQHPSVRKQRRSPEEPAPASPRVEAAHGTGGCRRRHRSQGRCSRAKVPQQAQASPRVEAAPRLRGMQHHCPREGPHPQQARLQPLNVNLLVPPPHPPLTPKPPRERCSLGAGRSTGTPLGASRIPRKHA